MQDLPPHFQIVLVSAWDVAPIEIASAADADQATTILHDQLQRFGQNQVQGELWIRRLDHGGRVILRMTIETLPEASRVDEFRWGDVD